MIAWLICGTRELSGNAMPRAAKIHRPHVTKTPRHNAQGKTATDRQRTRAHHTGSKAWKQQRIRVLQRDGFTCTACGHYGDQVDHINNDAHLVVGDDALATLCIVCHSRKTMTELNRAMR